MVENAVEELTDLGRRLYFASPSELRELIFHVRRIVEYQEARAALCRDDETDGFGDLVNMRIGKIALA